MFGIEKEIIQEAELRRQLFENINPEDLPSNSYSQHICSFWDTERYRNREAYDYGEIRQLKER